MPPSQGGQPLPEPPSPYLDSSQANALPAGPFGSQPPTLLGASASAGPSGINSQTASLGGNTKQQSFGMPSTAKGQAQPSQPSRIQFGQKAGQAAHNPFGASSSQTQANPFQVNAVQPNPFGQASSQSGRLQFGTKAGQPAATQFGPSNSRQDTVPAFGSQSKPAKAFNSTEDPFGRQKAVQPAAAQQQAAPGFASNPFAQQQHQPAAPSNPFAQQQQALPGTPAPFGALGGPQNGMSQSLQGAQFQTPAVQQRPAFAGGIAASLQAPSIGRQHCDYDWHDSTGLV